MKVLYCSLVLLLALQTGCSSLANYPGPVNCRYSLQSDLLRLFAIDEFSLEYTRNTFYYCNDGDCAKQRTQTALPAKASDLQQTSVAAQTDVQVQTLSQTAPSAPAGKTASDRK